MMTRHKQRVLDSLADIKSVYFPEWDVDNEWSIEIGTSGQARDNTGYCDSLSKRIILSESALVMPTDGVRALIIHEICHDAAAADHTQLWAERMEEAAVKAESVDDREVADILRTDILSYFGVL